MSKLRRLFTVVLAVAASSLVAGVLTGCSGDPSLEGLGAPEFLSVSAKADGNSVYLTCSYKGRGAGICGFVLTKGGSVVKKQEAETRSDGSFSLNIKDLEYDTEYVYYAWISNGTAEIHSNTGTVHTEQKPEPEQVFVSVTAKAEGNSVHLACTYEGLEADSFGFVLTKHKKEVKRQEAEMTKEGSFSLTFEDLEYDTDYGYYAWIVKGKEEIRSNTGTVHTEQKPEPEQVFVSVTAKAEGNSVHLACTYEGLEASGCGFVLTKDKGEVKREEAETTEDGSFSLTIKDLEYDTDYGYYAWIVKGKEEIRSITGTVHTEPKPVIAPAILSLSADADENVLTLRCTYEGEGVDGGGFYFNGSARLGADIIQDGNMSLTIGNLEYDQEYEFIAYITSGQTEIKSEPAKAHTGKMSSIPIPDAAFKSYVLGLYDSDKNGKLSMEEAEKITRLEIGTYDLQIKSLEGIEYFKNLEYLKAAGNGEAQPGELSRLDLSKNLKLETLICSFNKLEELYLGNNTALKYVDCSSNCLFYYSYYCPDFSQTTNLEYLDCHSNNSLYVNLGNNTALKYLDCSHTLEQGNFTGCTSLEYLDCSYSRADYVRIAGLKKLTTLKCEAMGGIIWEFDASGCENLVFDKHIFYGNVFQYFKAVGCNNLTTLDISYNGCAFYSIDIRDCKNLKSFKCSGLSVAQLDVRGCTSLSELECWDNFIGELDVSSQKKLKLGAWPQLDSFYKIWVGSGEYHYFNSSGEAINPADYGTEVIVKQ